MLRALVVLVHNVVSTFQMKRNRPLRDWHTDQAHVSLPREKNDPQQQEQQAVLQGITTKALILRSTPKACVSKDEGMLTASSSEPSGSVPLVRVPRGGGDPVLFSKERAKRTESPCGFWTPAFAGDACASARQSARR